MKSWSRSAHGGLLVCLLACVGLAGAAGVDEDFRTGPVSISNAASDKSVNLGDGRTVELINNGSGIILKRRGRPATRYWALPVPQRGASLTVMPSGRVLIWGGGGQDGQRAVIGQWFDPDGAALEPAELGLSPRTGHTATVLSDGLVLFAGGTSTIGKAELFDERSGVIEQLSSDVDRDGASARLEADGSVIIEGGKSVTGNERIVPLRYSTEKGIFAEVRQRRREDVETVATLVTNPPSGGQDVAPDVWLNVRFSSPIPDMALLAGHVTLVGPEGEVQTRLTLVEGGRLLFIKPLQDLFPGSAYTLMLDGLVAANGKVFPARIVDFKTREFPGADLGEGQKEAVERKRQDAVTGAHSSQQPCMRAQLFSPCAMRGSLKEGVWTPGKDNTYNRWRVYDQDVDVQHNANIAHIADIYRTTIVRGRIVRVDKVPVEGVDVSSGGQHATTNKDGWFNLFDLPAGANELYVDGSAANRNGLEFGQFVVGVQVKPGRLNELPYVMYLPRITTRDKIKISSPLRQDMVVSHPDMPGLELHIPKGTVIHDRKGRLVTELAIVPTPVNRAPFPVMENHPMAFTVEPGGAQIRGLDPARANGIRVYYPNYDGHAAGTVANFWIYEPTEGWRIYGRGTVSDDLKSIVPEEGVALHQTMGGMFSIPTNTAPSETGLAPEQTGYCGCGGGPGSGGAAAAGDPIDLKTGEFIHSETDVSISDIVPLVVSRSYRPHDMQSREFGVGMSFNWGYTLYNPGGTYDNLDLVLPTGSYIRFTRTNGNGPQGTWTQQGSPTGFGGAVLQSVYDSEPTQPWGRAYRITLRDGARMQFSSFNDIRLRWVEDRYGNRTSLVYSAGLITAIVSPSGRRLLLNYDSANRIQTITDHTGRQWSYQYNTLGLLAQVTRPGGSTQQYVYDTRLQSGVLAQHRIKSIVDARGHTVLDNTFEVVNGASTGRVIKQTRADGGEITIDYSHVVGGVTGTLVTEPDGSQRRIVFDSGSPYPLSETLAYGTPLLQTYTYERDTKGQLTARVDALGRRTEYTYDAASRVISATELAGQSSARTTQLSYTPEGDLHTVVDPLGHTTTLDYVQRCLSRITNPAGEVIQIQCNGAGLPLVITDPLGHTTQYHYDGYTLAGVTDSLGRSVTFRYDALGRRTSIQDAAGRLALTQYDALDRVTQSVDPLGRITEIGYDANGNVAGVLLPNGNGVTYTYDTRDRRLTRTDALGQVEHWAYDTMDRVTSYTDRLSRVTGYAYDALGRPTTTTYPNSGGTQTASYDAGNRLTALADSLSGMLGWSYDSFDAVTQVTGAQGTIDYTYDAAGRRTSMQAAAQAVVQYAYDTADRLTGITQGAESVGFAYDAASRLTTTTLPNQVQTVYAYNNADQVTGLAWGKVGQAALGSLGYGYDSLGQLVAQTGTHAPQGLPAASSNNSFDDNNRQTLANNVALSYDSNGNLISDGSRTYVWDDRDRLIQVKAGTSVIASFGYDALGRRISRTESGVTTTYLYDGLDAVQETQGTTVNPILTGAGIDQRYARNEASGRTYFLTDLLGSTRLLTDAAGAVVQRYDYDPYGTTTQTSAGITNPYQYTGRERDLSGLYYYRARYYQPSWSRFISEDPIGLIAGNNSYAYVEENPTQWVDSLGWQRFRPPPKFTRPGGGNSSQRRVWNRAQFRAIQQNSQTTPILTRGLMPEEISSESNIASLLTGIDYNQYCAVAICRSSPTSCGPGDIVSNWIPDNPTVPQVNAMGCTCAVPYYGDVAPIKDPDAGYGDLLQLVEAWFKRR